MAQLAEQPANIQSHALDWGNKATKRARTGRSSIEESAGGDKQAADRPYRFLLPRSRAGRSSSRHKRMEDLNRPLLPQSLAAVAVTATFGLAGAYCGAWGIIQVSEFCWDTANIGSIATCTSARGEVSYIQSRAQVLMA